MIEVRFYSQDSSAGYILPLAGFKPDGRLDVVNLSDDELQPTACQMAANAIGKDLGWGVVAWSEVLRLSDPVPPPPPRRVFVAGRAPYGADE